MKNDISLEDVMAEIQEFSTPADPAQYFTMAELMKESGRGRSSIRNVLKKMQEAGRLAVSRKDVTGLDRVVRSTVAYRILPVVPVKSKKAE